MYGHIHYMHKHIDSKWHAGGKNSVSRVSRLEKHTKKDKNYPESLIKTFASISLTQRM